MCVRGVWPRAGEVAVGGTKDEGEEKIERIATSDIASSNLFEKDPSYFLITLITGHFYTAFLHETDHKENTTDVKRERHGHSERGNHSGRRRAEITRISQLQPPIRRRSKFRCILRPEEGMEVLASWRFVQSTGVFTRHSGMPDIGCDGHLDSVGRCQCSDCKYKIRSVNGKDRLR